MSVYEQLLKIRREKGAGYFVLLDPDKQDVNRAVECAQFCQDSGVDALLVGGSLLLTPHFDLVVKKLKEVLNIPVIIFPGGVSQVSAHADAILFMSIVSGRNAEHLIGDQVKAAPIVKAIGLEPIATAYMLVESGKTTSAEYMSNTRPIPRNKPDIAAATALASECLGMKLIYLEAGSGADYPVPDEMVKVVSTYCSLPLIVGGGITTPDQAIQKVNAGASYIVTGTVVENENNYSLLKQFADAIHSN